MEYIVMGIGFAVGWSVIKLIYEVIEEVVFMRLHKMKWYRILTGKDPKKLKDDKKKDTNEIGFK